MVVSDWRRAQRAYAVVLCLLAFLFFLRVLGQALVVFFAVKFLPPMTAWYSGLIPYSVLLPIQALILVVQGKIGVDFWRGSGFFVTCRPMMGRLLRWFSYVYFASMCLRYILTGTLFIPVFFHWILAGYLFVLGHYHARLNYAPSDASGGMLGRG